MKRFSIVLFLFLLLLLFCHYFHVSASKPPQAQSPIRETELLALIGGGALPENIVAEIRRRGIAFEVDDFFRTQMEKAGADKSLFTTLETAKISAQSGANQAADKNMLVSLANATKLMGDKNFTEAATELRALGEDSFQNPEVAFVIAQLFRLQDRFEEAAVLYRGILEKYPDFPEVHTKLSFLEYRLQDPEGALRDAKAALAVTPNNAEAHKNAGLALAVLRKFDASEVEYLEALRLKPDYDAALADYGLMFHQKGNWSNAILQYRKALALDPDDSQTHYNLGLCFYQLGDLDSSMREYREVKRLEPNRFDARQNLGADLMNQGHYAEAVVEFREMEKIFPESAICHACLGEGLQRIGDPKGAEQEFLLGVKFDPSNPLPHMGLGDLRLDEQDYGKALEEYRQAEQLDSTHYGGHLGAGRALFAKKDFPAAIEELKQAENLQPSMAYIHDVYGQVAEASGDHDTAVSEFKQAIALDPIKPLVIVELASALEKKGDWPAAMDEYRKASEVDASIDSRGKLIRVDIPTPQQAHDSAQERFKEHISALKAAGRSSEAAQLQIDIKKLQAAPNLSEQVDAALQAADRSNMQGNYEGAMKHYKEAAALAEKIEPRDRRLMIALDQLGNGYSTHDPSAAQAAFERELKVAVEIYGPRTAPTAAPLESLGRNALARKDFADAERFFSQAMDENQRTFGESSKQVAFDLLLDSNMYLLRKNYEKAELYALRSLNIEESLFDKEGSDLLLPLASVCNLYDKWGKPDKLEVCNHQVLVILEKQYGANNLQLIPTLTKEAETLRSLGRVKEAEDVESRLAALRSSTMKMH